MSSFVILAAGLAVAFVLSQTAARIVWAEARQRYHTEAMMVHEEARHTLEYYRGGLVAVRTMFRASAHSQGKDFHTFTGPLRARVAYPGFTGFGYVDNASPRTAVVRSVDEALPYPARLGANVRADSTVAEALDRSFSTRGLVMTFEAGMKATAEYRLFLPVPGRRDGSVARPVGGWIAATLDVERMLAGAFNYEQPPAGLELFDGTTPTAYGWMAAWPTSFRGRTAEPGFTTSAQVPAFDRTWLARIRPIGDPLAPWEHRLPVLVLIAVSTLSLLAFALVWTLVGSRARALRMVDEATASLREAKAALAHQALHDPLTGLPNRRLLADRLGQAAARSSRVPGEVGLLFVDLDRFKEINDALGHDAGDLVLGAVAERIRSAVRPGDTVARIGGDEFVVLCEALECPADAERVATRVLSAVAEPILLSSGAVTLTTSIGIAMADCQGDLDDLLHRADAAMYKAKAAGRAGIALAETPAPAQVAVAYNGL